MLRPFFAAGLSATLLAAPPSARPQVQEPTLRAHMAFLASDLLEGRGTGQRGGDLTVAYLEAQARVMGLKPGHGDSYRQAVKIAGIRTSAKESPLALKAGGTTLTPAFGKDWVFGPGDAQAVHELAADLVFVGYGITAPEEGWDDYKGLDCAGKVLVMMVNDPQPTAEAPDRFGGKSLTYYGRWTYKFEEAKRQGAAGVLLIHTTPSASYGWSVVENGWTGERFALAEGAPLTGLQGWISNETAQALFKATGQDLDALRAAAERKDFRPVPLGARLEGTLKAAVRTVDQFNVAAVVPGTDPKLKDEVVIYSAHWDHLGKHEGTGDTLYNGAVDNASGTAALLAMADVARRNPSKRSQMFLWVCAEEQGLLGSAAYAVKPLWPLAKTAANLNLDSLNWVGATADIGIQGSERTDLEAFALRAAAGMGLRKAETEPDRGGGYFRSDHFSFAKAGVPAFSIHPGRTFLRDPEASKAKAATYGPKYHQPADEYDPAWDLSGMVQQAEFTLALGRLVADAPRRPQWKAGDPFGKARKP